MEQLRKEHAAETVRARVLGELESLGSHRWAGRYYSGDGLGANVSLILAPKSGYVYQRHGCLGVYDRNYGAIHDRNGVLTLEFTLPKANAFRGLAEELIPVTWGSRVYLIPPDEMVDFCNDVNAGMEPRTDIHGDHLLRDGDQAKQANGLPSVPDEFRRYLLAHPIEAKIVGVGGSKGKKTFVVLDRGKKQDLVPGLKLYVAQHESVLEFIRITKVEDDQSEGVLVHILRDEPEARMGWRVSTRLGKRALE